MAPRSLLCNSALSMVVNAGVEVQFAMADGLDAAWGSLVDMVEVQLMSGHDMLASLSQDATGQVHAAHMRGTPSSLCADITVQWPLKPQSLMLLQCTYGLIACRPASQSSMTCFQLVRCIIVCLFPACTHELARGLIAETS